MNPIRNHRKKGKKSANIWELEGEQEIFRDDKGCNWIQNGIKIFFDLFRSFHILSFDCHVNVDIRHVVILLKNSLEFLNYKWWRHHMIDRQGCILLIYKMNNTAFQIIIEYRTKYSNKIIFSKLVTVYYFTCQTYPWR